ncbi:hypothetical protein K474DRAFT_1669641 [Panus rudis PR-1116 ss-1]|nr:hypothetical protein K474DRAFT_1669641 [Panus rudis PR-1116 ss-1]
MLHHPPLDPDDAAATSTTSLVAVTGSPTPVFDEFLASSTTGFTWSWSEHRYLPLRILFFVPWCALVGAMIVLFPRHINLVTPSTSHPFFATIPAPGLRRFAHWGECAAHHVLIFLAPFAFLLLWNFKLGITILAILAATGFQQWREYIEKINSDEVEFGPLGEDDMDSVYLVLTDRYMDEDFEGFVDDIPHPATGEPGEEVTDSTVSDDETPTGSVSGFVPSPSL